MMVPEVDCLEAALHSFDQSSWVEILEDEAEEKLKPAVGSSTLSLLPVEVPDAKNSPRNLDLWPPPNLHSYFLQLQGGPEAQGSHFGAQEGGYQAQESQLQTTHLAASSDTIYQGRQRSVDLIQDTTVPLKFSPRSGPIQTWACVPEGFDDRFNSPPCLLYQHPIYQQQPQQLAPLKYESPFSEEHLPCPAPSPLPRPQLNVTAGQHQETGEVYSLGFDDLPVWPSHRHSGEGVVGSHKRLEADGFEGISETVWPPSLGAGGRMHSVPPIPGTPAHTPELCITTSYSSQVAGLKRWHSEPQTGDVTCQPVCIHTGDQVSVLRTNRRSNRRTSRLRSGEGHSFEKLRLKDDLKRVISGRGLDFDAKAWQPVDSKPVERRHLPRIRSNQLWEPIP